MLDGHFSGMGGIFMWIFWLLIILVVFWVAKQLLSTDSSKRDAEPSPREILERRLAQGEIDEEEFARKLQLLKH